MSRGAKCLYAQPLILATLISIALPTSGTPYSNSTGMMTAGASSGSVTGDEPMLCEMARMKCAYRTGCGNALQQYIGGCIADLHSNSKICPETCQHALIALISTDEGKDLMECHCLKNDHMCLRSKQRAEICRSSVQLALNKTRLSCRIATWICNADALCSKALDYYNGYCKSMFHGRKCTPRCRNSIAILRRQEKAAKLNTCVCDGDEDYDCKGIHHNMNFLCFGKTHQGKKINTDTRPNEIERDCGEMCKSSGAAAAAASAFEDSKFLVNRATILIFSFVSIIATAYS